MHSCVCSSKRRRCALSAVRMVGCDCMLRSERRPRLAVDRMSLLRAPSLLALRRAPGRLILLVFVFAAAIALRGAEPPRKTSNVPAAAAEDSLPMLADQA